MRRVLRTVPKGALLSVVLHGLLLGGLLGFRHEQRRAKPRRPPVRVTLVTKARAAKPRPLPPAPLPKQAAPKSLKKRAALARPKRAKQMARRVASAAARAPERPRTVRPVRAEAGQKASTPGQPRRFTVSLSATISSGGVSVPATLGGTGDITAAPARSTRRSGRVGDGEASPPVAPATTVMPSLISQPSRSQMRAAYPPRAREDGIEGDVRMKILVSATGQVTRVRLLRPAGNGFDEAARKLVRRFRFRAARKGGKAVAVWIPWTYKFRLSS